MESVSEDGQELPSGISRPTLMEQPADLRTECDVQPGGAGPFFRVSARVTGGALVCQPAASRLGMSGDEVEEDDSSAELPDGVMVVPLAGIGVSKPTEVRDGRPFCIKLRLPAKDVDGHSKHTLSVKDQATFDAWLQGLKDDFGVAASSARLMDGNAKASAAKLSMRSAALMASMSSNPELKARAQVAEMAALSHAGWMAKKGGVRRAWQKRYFEHSGDFLFYREAVGGELKGTIDLSVASDVRPSTEIDHKPWEMEIVTPERTYRLECETQEQLSGWFIALAQYSLDPDALINWTPHNEGDAIAVHARYLVLVNATARQRPDDDSLKLGEFERGQVIACVEEVTDAGGIVRVRSSTAPKGEPRGGWLKKATSKGKPLIERVEYDNSARALREQPVMSEADGGEQVCTSECTAAVPTGTTFQRKFIILNPKFVIFDETIILTDRLCSCFAVPVGVLMVILDRKPAEESVAGIEKWGVAMFKQFDTDGNGTLTKKELSHALRMLPKKKFKIQSVKDLMEKMDGDGDGGIEVRTSLMNSAAKTRNCVSKMRNFAVRNDEFRSSRSGSRTSRPARA